MGPSAYEDGSDAESVDRTADVQADRLRIARLREAFLREYPDAFDVMLGRWAEASGACEMSLMYAASYLFVTGEVRWAVDPVLPGSLLPDFPDGLRTEPLGELAFVLLTHDHSDHVDWELLASLRDSGVTFVVPEHMRDAVAERVKPRGGQMTVARWGERLELHGMGILPWDGLHWQTDPDGRRQGTDATGYLVEAEGRRWLFPGDVRDYRAEEVARFAPVDTLFAHLWLGRGRALDPAPPELDAFCEFLRAAEPRRVVLTHLYEFSRRPTDLWTDRHVGLIRERWKEMGEQAPIMTPRVGEMMVLCDGSAPEVSCPGRLSSA